MPSSSTGANGLPVATRAWPSVQVSTSAGSASAFEVGLDSGMMIGRRVCAAMSRTRASVNAPVWVEVPISMVGWTWATTSARPTVRPSADQPVTSAAGRA